MSFYAARRPGRRALGTNPRALGSNPRAQARKPWAVRAWKRKRRELGLKAGDPFLSMSDMKALERNRRKP